MRVLLTGATGNLGTSLVPLLSKDEKITEIIAVSRHTPEYPIAKVKWVSADVAKDDLDMNVDAVIHTAWQLDSAHNEKDTISSNVGGTSRLVHQVLSNKVPVFIVLSSVGAYSQGNKRDLVDETYPHDGVASSLYSTEKAALEHMLDDLEPLHPATSIIRLRPALMFKTTTGPHDKRLFLGHIPNAVLLHTPVLLLPDTLVTQAVHTDDVAAFAARIIHDPFPGAYNLESGPLITPKALAHFLGTKHMRVPEWLLRGIVDASWHLRLQPTSPGWLDLALSSPIMDSTKARNMGWEPTYTSLEALNQLFLGMHYDIGTVTDSLAP